MNIPQTQTPKQEREYLHTLSAGAFLPFLQATLLALVVLIAVWVIAALVFDVLDPHKPAVFVAALVWALMQWRLLKHWLSLTMPEMINVIQDLSDDGRLNNSNQPEPEEESQRVIRVEFTHIKENGHVQKDEFDLPGSEFQLTTLAKGLMIGAPFTERYWVRGQKLFSKDEFEKLRDAMRNRATPLAEYVDPEHKQQGMKLTEAGEQTMRKLSGVPHSPTPKKES